MKLLIQINPLINLMSVQVRVQEDEARVQEA
jgi:hypothetical protein